MERGAAVPWLTAWRPAIRLGRLGSTDVLLDATWLVLLPVLAWSLAVAYFPTSYPIFGAPLDWALGVGGAALVLASALAHTGTRLLLARAVAVAPCHVVVLMLGSAGWPPSGRVWRQAIVAGGGVLVSLLIGVLLFWAALNAGPTARPLEALAGCVALINLLLGLAQLVPALPFDGGCFMQAALVALRLRPDRAKAATLGAGLLAGSALLALGAWQVLLGNIQLGLWTVLAGLIILDGASRGHHGLSLPACGL